MSVRHKAQFPTPGCIVEFLQGNSPVMGYVLESQNDRIRLYTQTKKEVKLPPARLLPWFGPSASPSLNRAAIEGLLEEHIAKRQQLRSEINVEELWLLAEGEIPRASASWFATLIFDDPDIDCEAAMGHALLKHKTHFKFSPPEFEIYPLDIMEKRVEEARAAQLRETLALHGNKFFHKLWDVHLGKSSLTESDLPPAELADKLDATLHAVMADSEAQDAFWKLLSRGLPNDPHLALHLAVAWGIVPKHYNYLLDKAGYDAGSQWAVPFTNAAETIQRAMAEAQNAYGPVMGDAFVTVDPDSTIDRDDAFFVQQHANGDFTLKIAIACPSLVWPFGSALDKEVLRRATSLYLPEGDLHMLPPAIGCAFFSLDAGHQKLALVTTLHIDRNGVVQETDIAVRLVEPAANMTLCQAEALIASERGMDSPRPKPTNTPAQNTDIAPISVTATSKGSADSGFENFTSSVDFKDSEQSGGTEDSGNFRETADSTDAMNSGTTPCAHSLSGADERDDTPFGESLDFKQLMNSETPLLSVPSIPCPEELPQDFLAHTAMLKAAYALANALQTRRLQGGAVILERPDCDISLVPLEPSGCGVGEKLETASSTATSCAAATPEEVPEPAPKGLTREDTCLVRLAQAPATPRAHRVIGELMIAANAAMGRWANEQGIPLLYRNQDIALPPEYSRVWNQPHDIVRIARSLPAAALETQPRKHAGLGITAYATCTSPLRRYVDLLNQGQIIARLSQKPLPQSPESLNSLLPLLQARLDSVGQIQRTRPRYWKLLFFRQQGDKIWWPGVVTDENNAFVTVALPWAQMMVRGKRKLFQEKIVPGAQVMVRVGKIHPLQNEITLLEALEQ